MQRLRSNSRNSRNAEPPDHTFQRLHLDDEQRYDVSNNSHCRSIRKRHHLLFHDQALYFIRPGGRWKALTSHLWNIYGKAVIQKPTHNLQMHNGLEASSNPLEK